MYMRIILQVYNNNTYSNNICKNTSKNKIQEKQRRSLKYNFYIIFIHFIHPHAYTTYSFIMQIQ